MPTTDNQTILQLAIDGLEVKRAEIDRQLEDLRGRLEVAKGMTAPPRRVLSASARKRISDAQKKRWAAMRRKS